MATDNPSLIISVSAFGFGDSVVINGQAYVQEAPCPSVIVEAPNQKLFLYGERAMKERSGADFYGEHAYTGANATDASADTSPCTLVAVLWQQLKSCTDVVQKQEAANRICKHVVQLICDLKPTLEQEQSPLASLLNRSDLRAKAQLVLLIPDNFTEVEQQCLLNAFLGYDLRLLWRSVAALMGAVATSDRELFKLIRGNRIFTQNLVSSSQEPRTLVQVLYVGADSIDLSSYELKYERSSNYLVPVRQQAVYKDCAVGLNYLHFAVSSAHYYARQITTNMFEITRSGKGAQVEQSLFQQLINLNPNIWGINQDLKQTVLKVALGDTTKWVQLPNFKNNVRHNQALNRLDIQSFYQSFGLSPQLPAAPAAADLRHSSNITQASNRIMQPSITSSGYGAMRAKYAASTSSSVPTSTEAPTSTSASEVSFVEQLASAIQNKIAASSAAYCFVVGPDQLVLDNTLFAHLNKLLRQDRVVRTLQFQVLSAESLSQGGMIFQKRLNQGLTTYLDRLPKLSTILTNEAQDGYQERILIEEKEIKPQDEICTNLDLKILSGSSYIKFFVSSDPKLNQAAIDQSTKISFKEQGISVKKAELAFIAGSKAETDEPVTVSVMQKPLSGYVKIKIKPQGESQVLPPYGVTRAFDPVKIPDYADCMDRFARAYPSLTITNYYKPNISFVTSLNTAINNQLKKHWFDKTSANRWIGDYCRYVPDIPEYVNECCQLIIKIENKIEKLHSGHLLSIKILLEEHKICFDPKSPKFCMSYEFAQLMTNNSLNILEASLSEVTVRDLVKYLVVKGSRKLSISLLILMYSLMYRRKDRDYLASDNNLQQIKNLLYKVENHYEQTANELRKSTAVPVRFKRRFQEFVDDKLKMLIPQVIEYLDKKGTNPNIMAEINNLGDGENKD